MNTTVCLRRCLLLYGAWLSHSAYDARTVKMAVGIALENVNHDIPDIKSSKIYVVIAVCFVGSKPPILVSGKSNGLYVS